MTGYITKLPLFPDGTSAGTVCAHGTGKEYPFVNYSGVPLKVQARVTFDLQTVLWATQAINIVWDGETYDVQPNEVAAFQPGYPWT